MTSRIGSFLAALVLFTLAAIASGEETCENYDSRETAEPTCKGEESRHFHDNFNRDDWVDKNETKTLADLWFTLDCDYLYQKPRSIPTKADFKTSIELYNSLVDLSDHLDPDLETFRIKTEVKQSEGKGRGVFASESVKKGSILRTTDSAYFETGDEYREFIIGLEKDFACDGKLKELPFFILLLFLSFKNTFFALAVLQWAYSYRINGVPYVIVDLDNGELKNIFS
jgi:hypothetical protein